MRYRPLSVAILFVLVAALAPAPAAAQTSALVIDALPLAGPEATPVTVLGRGAPANAAVQVVVHMVYFLHMNTRVEGGWSMLALVFTLVLVIITLAGSIWVMYHLNTNMMPGMAPDGSHQMHQMP